MKRRMKWVVGVASAIIVCGLAAPGAIAETADPDWRLKESKCYDDSWTIVCKSHCHEDGKNCHVG